MENEKDCKVAQGLMSSPNTQEYWAKMNNDNESLILIHFVYLKKNLTLPVKL